MAMAMARQFLPLPIARPPGALWAPQAWKPVPLTRAGSNALAADTCQLDLVCFTLILDDIVLPPPLVPGFTVLPARLGGGGPQTLYGYQVASTGAQRLGLAAGVGADLPEEACQWLAAAGVSLDGLLLHEDMPTPRAWQIVEPDGRRHEIWRTQPGPAQAAMLLPPFSSLPPAYQAAKAYHVGINPSSPPLELLSHLQQAASVAARGGLVAAETFTQAQQPLSEQQLLEVVQFVDLFSPNEAEAISMLCRGAAEAEAARQKPWLLTEPLLAAGAQLVVLRRGPQGAVVHSQGTGEVWSVPAYPGTQVVDPTGCGNAFCGGLLAGLAAGLRPEAAAAWGAASASLMAEAHGVPLEPPAVQRAAAAERAAAVLPLMERL